jgi:hypothetical protein
MVQGNMVFAPEIHRPMCSPETGFFVSGKAGVKNKDIPVFHPVVPMHA